MVIILQLRFSSRGGISSFAASTFAAVAPLIIEIMTVKETAASLACLLYFEKPKPRVRTDQVGNEGIACLW